MRSNFSNTFRANQDLQQGVSFYNQFISCYDESHLLSDVRTKKYIEQTIRLTKHLSSLWKNENLPSLFTHKIARLVFCVKDLSFFECNNVYKAIEDEGELEIFISNRAFDECRISIYYDDEEENDYEVFLKYAIKGEYFIKSGTIPAIANLINTICEKKY